MSILDVIERARKEPPYLPPEPIFPDNFYTCEVFDPIPWDRRGMEQTFGFELPIELVDFWNACSGMRLYCDTLWCPGGLVVCSPSDESLRRVNSDYFDRKSDRIWFGDFIIAEFRSDLELVLIRCDKDAPDYNNIVIVSEMGPRDEWSNAASSLEEFLLKYMDAHGEKYWEYHYQKRLAEKTALEAQRNK